MRIAGLQQSQGSALLIQCTHSVADVAGKAQVERLQVEQGREAARAVGAHAAAKQLQLAAVCGWCDAVFVCEMTLGLTFVLRVQPVPPIAGGMEESGSSSKQHITPATGNSKLSEWTR